MSRNGWRPLERMATTTISQAQRELTGELKSAGDESWLAARVLVQHVTGKTAAWVLAHADETLTIEQEKELKRLAGRLTAGEPLPYITGFQEFYGINFEVNPRVLIPRPETELLVEMAIEWLSAHPERTRVVDVGTGSGCIGVTLALKAPAIRVTAVDISLEALDAASRNAQRLGAVDRMVFVRADLLDKVPGKFDLVAANLPYIPSGTLEGLAVRKYEPRLALDGGEDGLDLIGRLLKQAPEKINPGGMVLLEIEERQGVAAAKLAREAFPTAEVRVVRDLAGKDRVLEIRVAGE